MATVGEHDIEGRWPELFTGLDEKRRAAVLDAFAANSIDGWVPNREDVANLTDYARGAIDGDEYVRRVAALAARHRMTAAEA